MTRYRKHQGEAAEFLANLYETLSDGLIELRLKENGAKGAMLKRSFLETNRAAARWVANYADRESKIAIYYGVGKRAKATDGTKENVLGITALWADVDVLKHGWDMKGTVEALYRLPGVLQPSAIVCSGGGLHCYWLLKEPVTFHKGKDAVRWRDQVEEVESANRALQRLVSSDRVHDISRVLRLPGTWNTKASPRFVESVYFFRWHRSSLADLQDAAQSQEKVLGPDGFVHPTELPRPANTKIDPMKAFELAFNFHDGRKGSKTQNDIWDRCRLGGMPPYIGLDEAVLLSTALFWIQTGGDATDSAIVDQVLKYAKEVWARDHGHGSMTWSVDKQRAYIEDKLVRFKDKWKRRQAIFRKKRRDELRAKT